jgi:hypothetical protein
MKTTLIWLPALTAFTFTFALASSQAIAEEGPNDLVKFLAGNWENISFEILDGKPVKRESYLESMIVKDKDTLTITAHAFKDGKDLTKDMQIVVKGRHAVLSQGIFSAKGKREGNAYYFTGKEKGKEYRLRLFTMGDKYVFQREIWSDGQIQEIDMSYLLRQK